MEQPEETVKVYGLLKNFKYTWSKMKT